MTRYFSLVCRRWQLLAPADATDRRQAARRQPANVVQADERGDFGAARPTAASADCGGTFPVAAVMAPRSCAANQTGLGITRLDSFVAALSCSAVTAEPGSEGWGV